MPVGMNRIHAAVIGDKVYAGGGITDNKLDAVQVSQYDLSMGEWSRLPPHPVVYYAMAQFAGHLITVGGTTLDDRATARVGGSRTTSKVYRFKEESQNWEEFLKPMLTARFHLSVATTNSSIVASGGSTGVWSGDLVPCATVEVYSSETSQWYPADPLPVPCYIMTSVTIADTLYQLGGADINTKGLTVVMYAPLTALVQKATSPTHESADRMSVWKTLPNIPLKAPAAANLSGNLLAVGGWNDEIPASPAVHIFLPLTNSWVKVTSGDLPVPRCACTVVQLPSNQVLVAGGWDHQNKRTNTVFLGSITI